MSKKENVGEIPQPEGALADMIAEAARLIDATCEWRKFRSNPYPCAIITWKGGEVCVEAVSDKLGAGIETGGHYRGVGNMSYYTSAKKLAESIRGRINRELAADARDAHERKEREARDRAEVEARTALNSELRACLSEEYVDVLCGVKSTWDVKANKPVVWINVDCGKFSGEKLTVGEAQTFIIALETAGHFDLVAMAKAYYKLEE